jgi:signal peptidase I
MIRPYKCLNLLARLCQIIALAVLLAGVAVLIGLHAKGYELLSVQTASMTPVFRPGDALIVAPATIRRPRPGQVISYQSPRDSRVIISHRLIGYKNGRMITAGDALSDPDPPVPPRLLVGRAVAVMPKFGYVLDVLRQPIGLTVFVILPAVIVLIAEAKRLTRTWSAADYRLYGYR